MDKKIKNFVTWQLEHYPQNKKELKKQRERMEEIRAAMGGTGKAVPPSPGEERYLRELEKSVNAVAYVVERLNGEDRALIELVYWRGSHSVEGAARQLHFSKSSAYRHINGILTDLAREFGYVPAV